MENIKGNRGEHRKQPQTQRTSRINVENIKGKRGEHQEQTWSKGKRGEHQGQTRKTSTVNVENINSKRGEHQVNEANMSQLAKEKQVNLGTSARLNALSRYLPKISFSVDGGKRREH